MTVKFEDLVVGRKYRIVRPAPPSEMAHWEPGPDGMIVELVEKRISEVGNEFTILKFTPEDVYTLRDTAKFTGRHPLQKEVYCPQLAEVEEQPVDPRPAIEQAWGDYLDQTELTISGPNAGDVLVAIEDAFEAGYRAALEKGGG